MPRRLKRMLQIGSVLAVCGTNAIQAQTQPQPLAIAVEAADLYKFADFVQWPAAVEAAPGPFTLCIVGDGPFGAMLDAVVQGQAVRGHSIVVQRYAAIANNPGCRTVFAAGSSAETPAQIIAAVRGTPVLTVTSEAADDASAGIINFVLRDQRVRFEIDAAAAAANGLSISSKLQGLALAVRPSSVQ